MKITFSPTIEEFFQSRASERITVISGLNNAGKSLILKRLLIADQGNPCLVQVSRFNNFRNLKNDEMQPVDPNKHRNDTKDGLVRDTNGESNQFNLGPILKNLEDEKRGQLLDLCGRLLSAKFTISHENPKNSMTPLVLHIDGENLSTSSSGTRLLMTLLGISLDTTFSSLYIDEPELGLSPRLQSIVSDYFFSEESREKFFPHLERIVFATHSHLFLDRKAINNNFVVSRDADSVEIQPVGSVMDFHRLQFNMLGNTFESLFFPSAIVIVEGPTDHDYLEKLIGIHFSNKRVSVVSAGSDDRTLQVVHSISDLLGDLQSNPFRERVFVVLDKIHGPRLKEKLLAKGVKEENIVIWTENGIEFLYPPSLVAEVFACSEAELPSPLVLTDDRIEINGITKTKMELGTAMKSRINSGTPLPAELVDKLMKAIERAVS